MKSRCFHSSHWLSLLSKNIISCLYLTFNFIFPGWCSRVHSSMQGNEALPQLIENSPHLKKIFFTANRHITDNELKLLAKHCPLLEQLDLLGNNNVSAYGVRLVMQHCQNMKFCDLSFCGHIKEEVFKDLVRDFPKCAFKQSFSNWRSNWNLANSLEWVTFYEKINFYKFSWQTCQAQLLIPKPVFSHWSTFSLNVLICIPVSNLQKTIIKFLLSFSQNS